MTVRPEQWTHHHTNRLFHVSMLTCALFIVGVILYGGSIVLWEANADTNPSSDSVSVTASVPEVSPGPISGGMLPRPPVKPPVPPATQPASMTIEAEPRGQIPKQEARDSQGNIRTIYVFSTDKPKFSGHTSIARALIFLKVSSSSAHTIYGSTQADEKGDWQWQPPLALQPGSYVIVATAQDYNDWSVQASAQLEFRVASSVTVPAQPVRPGSPASPLQPGQSRPPVPSPVIPLPGSIIPTPGPINPDEQFGLFLEIQDHYKVMDPGNKIIATVTYIDGGTKQEYTQEITYTIQSPDGTVISTATDLLSVSRQASVLKTFYIAPNARPGTYTITAATYHNGRLAVVADTFTVRVQATAAGSTENQTPMSFWLLLQIIIGLLLLFIALLLTAWYWARKHHQHIVRPI